MHNAQLSLKDKKMYSKDAKIFFFLFQKYIIFFYEQSFLNLLLPDLPVVAHFLYARSWFYQQHCDVVHSDVQDQINILLPKNREKE